MEQQRLEAYLGRIGLERSPAPDPAGLTQLQRAHRLAIPFENLSIALGDGIAIDSDRVFDKFVDQRRGGYCFEQNRLFGDVLASLGMPNRALLARVRLGAAGEPHPPRTHVLLLVELGPDRWIADVGFGGSYVPPLPLRDGAVVASPDGATHRLRRIGTPGSLGGEWLLERAGPFSSTDGRGLSHGEWQPQYSFDLSEVAQADLDQANHWTATAASSRFTRLHIVTLALAEGFASLIDTNLQVAAGASTEHREIADLADYRRTLSEQFNLPLSEEQAAALPLFRRS